MTLAVAHRRSVHWQVWFRGFFDHQDRDDFAPPALVQRLQPAGWLPLGYLVVSGVIAAAIYGFSETPIGPAHYLLTLVALVLALVALRYPAFGIVLVVSAVLIMPPGTRIPGITQASPNLLFTVCTLAGFLVRIVRSRQSLAWSRHYFALVPLLIFHAAFAIVGYGPRSPFLFQTFVQGTLPFPLSNTAQRTRPMLLLALVGLVIAYTARSVYLLVVEGFPSCWNPYPHNSGGLGPLRYGHTLYGDPATVLAWVANLMVGLTLGMFVFARGWQSRCFFFFTFVVATLIAWMSLARGGMLGSTIALVAVGVMALRARQWAPVTVGVATFVVIVGFVCSCLPLLPHLQDSMGIDLGMKDNSRGAFLVEGASRFTGPNPLFTEEEIASSDDWGGVPNLLYGDGPGARRGYHSYVLNSAVDYGLPFLALVGLMFWFVLKTGRRLVSASTRAEPLVRGAAVGLLAGAIVAIFQAVFDTTLRVAGYAMVFWFLRGVEASLLSSLSPDE